MRPFLTIVVALLAVPGSSIAAELTLIYSVDVGGEAASLAQIGAFSKGVREGGRPTLLVDGGNALSPVEEAYVSRRHSSLSVHLMNRAGYDLWFAGHRDASRDGFSTYAATADFPVIATNLHRPETGRPPLQVQSLTVVRAGRSKVGVIGLSATMEGYTVGDPISAARYYIPLLDSQCDLIVAITDLTREEVSRLAKVEGLDVVLNRTPGETAGEAIEGEAFVAHIGSRLAGIDLSYEAGSVTNASVSEVDLDHLPEAAGFDLSDWSVTIEGQPVSLSSPIGQSSGGFTHAATGYYISDVIREAAGTDLGLVSVGHVGQGPGKGPVTPSDLIHIYPYEAKIGVATLKGIQLRELLSLSEIGELMFYPSGAVVVYERPSESVGTLIDILVGGMPLEDRKEYTVAVETGVHFPGRVRATDTSVRDALAGAIRISPSIKGVVDGRIQKR